MSTTKTLDHEIVDGLHGHDLVCRAPMSAPCHRRCSTGTCESWNNDGCQCGPLVAVKDCNAVDWIDAAGIEDSGPEGIPAAFDDEGELIYRGPVEIEWTGDDYVWHMPDRG
jgi:hypothetical protein